MVMSDHSNGNRSMVPGLCAAFVGGALLGAGLALLYAPRTGKETRQMLAKKAQDLKDAAADAIGRGRHLAGAMRQRMGEAIHRGQEAVGEAGDDGGGRTA
jgi:gas vesicle protein